MLHGTLNPNGSATTYFFQWGLTTAYGVDSVARSAGHGTKAVAVSITARALIPGTTYHYRLVATNGAGTTIGGDRAFTTAGNPPPTVATGPASQVGKNAATVTAVVGPNKQATTYYFQYGTSTTYGAQTIPPPSRPARSGDRRRHAHWARGPDDLPLPRGGCGTATPPRNSASTRRS